MPRRMTERFKLMVTTTVVLVLLVAAMRVVVLAAVLFWPTDIPSSRLERLIRAWRRSTTKRDSR